MCWPSPSPCRSSPESCSDRPVPLALARHPHESLKAGAIVRGPAQLRIRRILVASELALAVVPLGGAALMLKSSWRMNAHRRVSSGEGAATASQNAGLRYRARLAQEAYMNELLRRAEQAPGVHSRASRTGSYFPGRRPFPRCAARSAARHPAERGSTGYLKAIGMKLVKGAGGRYRPPDRVMLNEAWRRRSARSIRSAGSFPSPNRHCRGRRWRLKYSQLDADRLRRSTSDTTRFLF